MEDLYYKKRELNRLFLRTSKLIANETRRIKEIGYYSAKGTRIIPPLYRNYKHQGFNEAYIAYINIGGTLNFQEYKNVILAYTDVIKSLLLEGVVIKLPQKLGFLAITSNIRKYKGVNWFETNKQKKQFLEQGIDIKTKDNMTGVNYFVYRTDPVYPYLRWYKYRVVNARYFVFSPFRPLLREMFNISDADKSYLERIITKQDFYTIRRGSKKK